MSFLKQDYEIPEKPSNYMKLQKGMNKFRILSEAITGWEYWNTDNKPVRSPEPFEGIPEDIKLENGIPTPIKHFWAFVVWNYAVKQVQILQITQVTIQNGIKLGVDLREGNATNNDIGVVRKGDGFDTEYEVQFSDPSPVPPEAETAFKAMKINLNALFTGEDPFGSDTPTERKEDPYLGSKVGNMTQEETEKFVEDIPF